MAALTTIIGNMQTLVNGLTGVKQAGYPPESINQVPFGVVYPTNTEWSIVGGAWSEDFADIVVEVYCSRENLVKAVPAALPYYERFRNALGNDPTLSGAIQTPHGQDRPIVGTFGRLEYTADKGKPQLYLGWRFVIRVKIHSTLS